jgi:hypothetical protein
LDRASAPLASPGARLEERRIRNVTLHLPPPSALTGSCSSRLLASFNRPAPAGFGRAAGQEAHCCAHVTIHLPAAGGWPLRAVHRRWMIHPARADRSGRTKAEDVNS